jgi:phage FluMu protein Com
MSKTDGIYIKCPRCKQVMDGYSFHELPIQTECIRCSFMFWAMEEMVCDIDGGD